MKYVVFDLEWNQSNTGQEKEVERFPFEIIEIGAVLLSGEGETLDRFNELIKPMVYREMHRITGKLLHLDMSMLKSCRRFPEVAADFEAWCGEEDYLFCTWGTLDVMELRRNRKFYEMAPLAEGPMIYLDVQKLFALTYDKKDSKKRRSLADAVEYLGLESRVPFHRAFSDAYYTAEVFKRILRENPEVLDYVSYDTFYPPADRKSEIRHGFDTYFKYISRTFPDKKTLLTDREVASSKCYLCHRNLRKTVKWFTPNNRHYYCLAFCTQHGFLKGKIRINRTQEGEVYAVKTTRLVSEEEGKSVIRRSEHLKDMKKKAERKE